MSILKRHLQDGHAAEGYRNGADGEDDYGDDEQDDAGFREGVSNALRRQLRQAQETEAILHSSAAATGDPWRSSSHRTICTFLKFADRSNCASRMPQKRKMKKDLKNAPEANPVNRRAKVKQEEEQPAPLSPGSQARELRAAGALARLEQRSNPMEAVETGHGSSILASVLQKREDSVTAIKAIYPDKLMRKIEAMKAKAKKRDICASDAIYVVAHSISGQWVDSEFTIAGASHSLQSANELAMKYFGELDSYIAHEGWDSREEHSNFYEASSDTGGPDMSESTWSIGEDGCLELYCDEGKHGCHQVFVKRVGNSP